MVALRRLLDLLDQVEDDRHLVDAHAGRRLVEHEDRRFHREQDRHLELALVAMAERGGARACAGQQTHALEHRPRRDR